MRNRWIYSSKNLDWGYQDKSAHLVKAGSKTRLFGGGVDDGVVESSQSLARHSLEGPRAQAYAFCAHL